MLPVPFYFRFPLWLAIGLLLLQTGCQRTAPLQAELTVAEAMGNTDTAGYARVLHPQPFDFPADHGPHPAYKTEWWYFTGNLSARDGRRFGYQLTFFRSALAPPDSTPARSTPWAARDLYLAHFAVTDVAGEQFFAREDLQRGALGLAGMDTSPVRVFVGDWKMAAETTRDLLPITLRAQQPDAAIQLTLTRTKPYVLQGDRGYSPKSSQRGNASYYYSATRLPTNGWVVVQGDSFQVEGASWLDREWSTSALASNQVGWDWFALQLNDSTELMLYQLRLQSGQPDPASAGSFVQADGRSQTLSQPDFQLTVLDQWTHPRSGIRYPSRWRVQVPSQQLDLTVTPLLADQELPLRIRYWEGAVRFQGTRRGKPVDGFGYVELTGYDDASGESRPAH